MTERHQRRLAAIFAADIAGYSSLMGADEARTMTQLKANQAIILPMIARYGGRVIDTAGDGILAEFVSVVNAVECAILIQETMSRRNAELEEQERMRYRIGINLGDVMYDETRIYGDGINIAARLESIAEPGGICISDKVYQEIHGKIAVRCKDLGPQSLKNISRPVRAHRIDLAGLAVPSAKQESSDLSWVTGSAPRFVTWLPRHNRTSVLGALVVVLMIAGSVVTWRMFPGKGDPLRFNLAGTGRTTIAVLPLRSLDPDGGPDYFADGLTEDIISALGRFRDLAVMSRNAVFIYKGKNPSPEEIARELKVRYAVDGSVRRSLTSIRVSVSLTDVTRRTVLWSKKYDAEPKDIFSLQDQITRRISGALAARVTSLETASAKAKVPTNLEAYDLVLRGRELLHRLTRASNAEARLIFDRVVEIDPTYAPGYIGLGRVNRYAAIQGWTGDPSGALERAENLARKAIALDDLNPGAHALLGQVLLQFGDTDRAYDELRRSIDLNNSDTEALGGLVPVLLWRGNTKEAIAAGELLMDFQPELSAPDSFHIATAYVLAERNQDAIRTLQRSLDRNREEPNTNIMLAAAYAAANRLPEAERQAKFVRQKFPLFSREEFGSQLKDLVQKEKIRELLQKAGL